MLLQSQTSLLRLRDTALQTMEKQIKKTDMLRLAKRAGVKRIQGAIYRPMRNAIKYLQETIVKDALTITVYCRRSTVQLGDILRALKRQGRAVVV